MSVKLKLTDFITEQNNYFDSIDLSRDKFSNDIGEFIKILDIFNNYIKNINFIKNRHYLLIVLKNSITKKIMYYSLIKNILKIYNYCNILYDNTRIDIRNSEQFKKVLNFYIKCILSASLILYQYYYIDILNNETEKTEMNSIELFFEKFIRNNQIMIENEKFYKLKEEIVQINQERKDERKILDLISRTLLIIYNITFFDELFINYLNIFNLNDRIMVNLRRKNFEKDLVLSKIQTIIINSYKKYKETILLSLNYYKYITLPNYTGYCWFVSFLTGLTYSNKNKNLLNKKMQDRNYAMQIKELSRINISRETSDTIFKSFVFYIIRNITNIFKTYSDNLMDDCEILKYLKKIPLVILNKMIEEINSSILYEQQQTAKTHLNICRERIKANSADFYNYIYRYFIFKNKFKKENFYEIQKSDLIIIKNFYELLDIKCLFIYEINNKKYANQREFKSDIIFDIIILLKLEIFDIVNANDYREIDDMDFPIRDSKMFNYNGLNYELDYIMNMTDDKTCSAGCGHCICAINYNNEEYYYDSLYSIKKIYCDSDELLLPCSLIKKKWSNNLKKFCFSLEGCNYIKDYNPFNIKMEENEIYTENSQKNCYRETDVLYCYVIK